MKELKRHPSLSRSLGAARTWFGRSPRRMRRLSTAGGLSMIGLAVHLAERTLGMIAMRDWWRA